MERERPDYLSELPKPRWEFPWMGLWAVLLLGMAGAGIWLHLKTGDAWNARFNAPPVQPATTAAIPAPKTEPDPTKEAKIAAVRMHREQAERREQQQRGEIRCIGGVLFRRIPGGWENVPGETCP